MTYDIKLVQGAADSIPVILEAGGIGANLTGGEITFIMKNDIGAVRVEILCTAGATVNGSIVPLSSGGVTLEVSPMDSAIAGVYFGQFRVIFDEYPDKPAIFPEEGYVMVRIQKAV